MKKIVSGLVAAMALTGSALAADLPVRGAAPAPVYAVPVFTWSGFYVGVNGGYFTSSTQLTFPGFAGNTVGKPQPDGFRAGGQIGYRHQYANNLVVGVEADGSWLNNGNKRAIIGQFAPNAWQLANQGWDASIRGTLGYALNNVLIYATGGAAFTAVKGCIIANIAVPICVPGTNFSGSRTGWTVGGGLEYAINNAWSVRGEYLYANYGTKNYVTPPAGAGTSRVRYDTHSFRIGLNYRFGAPAAPVVAKY